MHTHTHAHTTPHTHTHTRTRRSFISDITTPQCRALLKREAAGSLFDVVLHDGAPNVGGAWASEAYTQVRRACGAPHVAHVAHVTHVTHACARA
jgi:23S rRNA U2552 (ribose-2'-O)-methylase RlmE/FtsJ